MKKMWIFLGFFVQMTLLTSCDLFKPDLITPFQKADINEDGALDQPEFERYICYKSSGLPCMRMEQQGPEALVYYDRDGSGNISEPEFWESAQFLRCMDKDIDSYVSKTEFWKNAFNCRKLP